VGSCVSSGREGKGGGLEELGKRDRERERCQFKGQRIDSSLSFFAIFGEKGKGKERKGKKVKISLDSLEVGLN